MLTTILRSKTLELEGFNPQCVVLRTQDEKPLDEPCRFMTHLEGMSDRGERFTISGNYDLCLEDAMTDFNSRVKALETFREIRK